MMFQLRVGSLDRTFLSLPFVCMCFVVVVCWVTGVVRLAQYRPMSNYKLCSFNDFDQACDVRALTKVNNNNNT